MLIFIVMREDAWGSPTDEIIKVFSTEEKAKAYIANLTNVPEYYSYYTEKHSVM